MRETADGRERGAAHPIRVLLVYLAVVFVGAAVVSPWVWQLAQWSAREHGVGRGLAGQPFHRYVHRSLLVLALGLLWPLVRAFRLRTWAEVGWRWEAAEAKRWLWGFLLGLATLGAAMAAALAGGGRVWNADGASGHWAGKLSGAAGAAIAVTVLEEFLFRGAVFSALRRQWGFLAAATTTSVVYAWVHFFERTDSPATVDAGSGFRILGAMCRGFVDPAVLVPGLGSLFLAGWMLATLRERTRGLGAAMGLHAGWIFWIRAYSWLTTDVAGANPRWWGTGKLYDGWVAFALLAGLAIGVHVWARPADHDPASHETDRR